MEKEALIKDSQDYAKASGFSLNPDPEALERIFRGLLENEKKHGFLFCPCRRVTGNSEEDKKNICPCFYHRGEIKKDGHCLCALFFG